VHEARTIAVAVLTIVTALLASGHVVLHKRDVRSALGWIGFIWFAPIVGPAAYVVFGVNRIRRAAMRRGMPSLRTRVAPDEAGPPPIAPGAQHLAGLVSLADAVVRRPLVAGNAVELLAGGEHVYPAMLAAIDAAQASVTFCTYIFDRGRAGDAFVAALSRANARGVKVRVLIDGVGARYRFPPIHRRLRREGVRTALFLQRLSPGFLPFVNLRTHRKVLVVDGRVGFTGGMNVRDDFLPFGGRRPAMDLHARMQGPVVAHLQSAFAEDWLFTTGEVLDEDRFFPPLPAAGSVVARGVTDGPDEDFETIRFLLLGALATARRRVRIVTPYFLPDTALVTALNVASLRGVDIGIVVPARTNLPLVQWAQTAQLWQVLDRGCRVWLSPEPFDHTKLMVVDGEWTLLGSANWDPRSLRLNFELDVECWDADLAARAEALVDERIERGREVTLAQVDGRPLPMKLRDGVARLLSPYL
jgi:cardiolipin synthase A/B